MQETGPAKYFRLLQVGEVIKEGDVFISDDTPANHLLPIRESIGRSITQYDPNDVFRPVEVDEWIDYAKQKPTEADRDRRGEVQFISTKGYSVCTAPSRISNGMLMGYGLVTHWRRITPPQPILKRVKVREVDGIQREVIPQPDGSLTVGCVTISAADFDEIARQRSAAMTGKQ
jgi:hypothetical protein